MEARLVSKQLGDNLVVDLSVKSDEERIVDLMELFNDHPNEIVTVVGTVDENGNPNTAPISLILARDERTLLIALKRGQTTTQNLRQNDKLSVEVLAENDMAVGIKGKAKLLKEPMSNNEEMSLWEVQVKEVKQDTSPAVIVTSGPETKPRSKRGGKFGQAMIKEMREYE